MVVAMMMIGMPISGLSRSHMVKREGIMVMIDGEYLQGSQGADSAFSQLTSLATELYKAHSLIIGSS